MGIEDSHQVEGEVSKEEFALARRGFTKQQIRSVVIVRALVARELGCATGAFDDDNGKLGPALLRDIFTDASCPDLPPCRERDSLELLVEAGALFDRASQVKDTATLWSAGYFVELATEARRKASSVEAPERKIEDVNQAETLLREAEQSEWYLLVRHRNPATARLLSDEEWSRLANAIEELGRAGAARGHPGQWLER